MWQRRKGASVWHSISLIIILFRQRHTQWTPANYYIRIAFPLDFLEMKKMTTMWFLDRVKIRSFILEKHQVDAISNFDSSSKPFLLKIPLIPNPSDLSGIIRNVCFVHQIRFLAKNKFQCVLIDNKDIKVDCSLFPCPRNR